MKTLIVRFICEETAQDIIEYAFLGMFISTVAILALTAIGPDVNTLYGTIQGPTAAAAANGQ